MEKPSDPRLEGQGGGDPQVRVRSVTYRNRQASSGLTGTRSCRSAVLFGALTRTFRNALRALTRRRPGVRVPQRPSESAGQQSSCVAPPGRVDREVRLRSVRDRDFSCSVRGRRELRRCPGGGRQFEPASPTQCAGQKAADSQPGGRTCSKSVADREVRSRRRASDWGGVRSL